MATLGFKGKSVLVYGLGKVGLATAESLLEEGASVYVYDQSGQGKFLSQERANSVLYRTTFVNDIHSFDFSQFSAVFKSPGIPMDDAVISKAKALNVPIMGDVDLLFRREKGAIFIGITGTNGKSTTTALVGHILQAAGLSVAVGGNLGTACLDLASGKDIYVLELSSYQLEIMSETRINRGLILNLTPDHLARHGDMETYLLTKKRIFEHQREGDISVICTDSDSLLGINCTSEVSTSALNKSAKITVGELGTLYDSGKFIMDLATLTHLPGIHNWQNIACSYGLLDNLVTPEVFCKSLKTFKPLDHRMQEVAKYKNVTFYNDSKATNAEAVIPALTSVKNIYWIAGGQAKAAGISPCAPHLKNVKKAYLIGASAEDFKVQIDAANWGTKTAICHTLVGAVADIFLDLGKNGEFSDVNGSFATVLLSPAAASWDQFESFEARGDVFKNAVLKHISDIKKDS